MLAFLFFLCLAVVGVVGQLTDADFAKIGYLLTSLSNKFDTLSTTPSNTFDTLSGCRTCC